MVSIMEDVKADMRRQDMHATGETEKLFEVKMHAKDNILEAQLWGPSYLASLITGRGPTKKSGGSGGETLQQALFRWIQAKGIIPDDPKMTQESLSWAMAIHMHNHGNVLYQKRGNTGILSNHITDSRIDAAMAVIGDDVTDEVITDFNQLFQ